MTKLKFDLLDDESAMQTIETVGKLAAENNIEWALAGGLEINRTRLSALVRPRRRTNPRRRTQQN